VGSVSLLTVPLFYDGEVVEHALVDDADYAAVSAYRWRYDFAVGLQYASRQARASDTDPTGSRIAMHRSVLGIGYGDPRVVHHINENKLDNRRSNLQVCTNASEHGRTPHSHWQWMRHPNWVERYRAGVTA
jgi:hypothetical protein